VGGAVLAGDGGVGGAVDAVEVAELVAVGVVAAGAAVVADAVEAVVADSPPPPLQADASRIAAVKRSRVVCAMAQIYQLRGGVRSRSEGA
jgi:hypothetical protein